MISTNQSTVSSQSRPMRGLHSDLFTQGRSCRTELTPGDLSVCPPPPPENISIKYSTNILEYFHHIKQKLRKNEMIRRENCRGGTIPDWSDTFQHFSNSELKNNKKKIPSRHFHLNFITFLDIKCLFLEEIYPKPFCFYIFSVLFVKGFEKMMTIPNIGSVTKENIFST